MRVLGVTSSQRLAGSTKLIHGALVPNPVYRITFQPLPAYLIRGDWP